MHLPSLRFVICLVLFVAGLNRFAAAAPAVVVSVPDQKLAVIDNGIPVAQFPVSTSKFGVGDRPGSYATPLGLMEIAAKIGEDAPVKRKRSRPDRDAHSVVAWFGKTQLESVRPQYLYSRHAGRTIDRPPVELWLHSDAVSRRRKSVCHDQRWDKD